MVAADGAGEFPVMGESRAGHIDDLPVAPGSVAYITTGGAGVGGCRPVVGVVGLGIVVWLAARGWEGCGRPAGCPWVPPGQGPEGGGAVGGLGEGGGVHQGVRALGWHAVEILGGGGRGGGQGSRRYEARGCVPRARVRVSMRGGQGWARRRTVWLVPRATCPHGMYRPSACPRAALLLASRRRSRARGGRCRDPGGGHGAPPWS